MSEDKRIILVNNYLKRNYVKEHDLRILYLSRKKFGRGCFMFGTTPKLLFYQIHTIAMLVN